MELMQKAKSPKATKLQTLANAFLSGERLTGREIINDIGINDFKTAIWTLRTKKEMTISKVMKQGKTSKYAEYFMTAQSIKEYTKNLHAKIAKPSKNQDYSEKRLANSCK